MIEIIFTFVGSGGNKQESHPIEWNYNAIPSVGDYIRLSHIIDLGYHDYSDFNIIKDSKWRASSITWIYRGKVIIDCDQCLS